MIEDLINFVSIGVTIISIIVTALSIYKETKK